MTYRRTGLEANALGDEMVFFDEGSGKYFAVSPVGSEIWKLLETPMNFETIVERLLEQYEVDDTVCREETDRFLQRMLAAGLLTSE